MNFDNSFRNMMKSNRSSTDSTLGNSGLGYQNNGTYLADDYQVGASIAPGKEIGQDGELKDSSVKKLITAGGRGLAAYGTGGASLGKDKEVLNSEPVNQAIGTISDIAEQNKVIKTTADVLEKAGVTDVANEAMDVVGDLKEGKVLEAAKDINKVKRTIKKKTIRHAAMIGCSVVGFVLIILVVIMGPVIGGMVQITDVFEGEMGSNSIGSNMVTGSLTQQIFANLGTNYNDLSDTRKAIVLAATSKVGSKYLYGGHPTGPGASGFPEAGVDCAGFVQWALWTATGVNPSLDAGTTYLTTSTLYTLIGKNFTLITKEELQPGDVGLKIRKGNQDGHTGIYLGNGTYVHAAGRKKGVITGKYNSFEYYLRYSGVN